MDFYIDIKYREVVKRPFPWIFKKKTRIPKEVYIFSKRGKNGTSSFGIDIDHPNITQERMSTSIMYHILNGTDDCHTRFFGIDTLVKGTLFYDILQEIPYWMPKNIMDIELYANTYILPRVDFNKLVEQDKIDFLPNRKLSMPEIKEAIKLHVDYPSEELYKNAEWIYQLHKFYTELEQQL